MLLKPAFFRMMTALVLLVFAFQTCIDRGFNGPEEGYGYPSPTLDPTKEAYVAGFAGGWDTNWGVMNCNVTGQKVNCEYTYENGRIEAFLSEDGQTMVGTWAEAPSFTPPGDGGKVTFSLSDSGTAIFGHWWYGPDAEGGSWTGTRIVP